jgi:hypothetical protein
LLPVQRSTAPKHATSPSAERASPRGSTPFSRNERETPLTGGLGIRQNA